MESNGKKRRKAVKGTCICPPGVVTAWRVLVKTPSSGFLMENADQEKNLNGK